MELYWDVALVVIGSLYAASGVAAITRGWVFPWSRRHVGRLRLYGGGQLVLAFALCWQGLFGTVIGDPDARSTGSVIGSVTVVAALFVINRGYGDGRRSGGAS
ncbi:hypothetical protein ACFYXS_01285 [Streptomyces sp. NPDC002574]|uniref:hypothetical protein n=1 Tax=Streptomyces sp. NPDC002574 TaxID=3364652 RepID=UPI00368218C8